MGQSKFNQRAILASLMPKAVTAQTYDLSGGDFADKAQLHVTSSGRDADPKGWNATVAVLTKFGPEAVAFHYQSILTPASFSLEVAFEDDKVGSAAVAMWNSFFPESDEDEDEEDEEDA